MVDNISQTPDYQKTFGSASADIAAASRGPAPQGKEKETEENVQMALAAQSDQITKAMENLASRFNDDSVSLDILLEVMANLSLMTRTLQKIAMAEADEMGFTSKGLAAYTKLMNEVKIWTEADFDPKMDAKEKLDKINQKNNESSIITERLRSNRDMLSEDAKKIQSTINASDDAQKGMLDFMQTFLQKQREWLSGIFR